MIASIPAIGIQNVPASIVSILSLVPFGISWDVSPWGLLRPPSADPPTSINLC